MFELDKTAGIGFFRVVASDQDQRSTGWIGFVFFGKSPGQRLVAQIYNRDELIVSANAAFFYLADLHYFTKIILI